MFNRYRLVHLGAPCVSLGSFVLFGEFRRALGAFGFIPVRWFIRVLNGGRWVYLRSFSSFARTPGVVGFIRVRLMNSQVVMGFIRVQYIHYGAPRGSLGSVGFVWFIWARPWARRVLSCSFVSLGRAVGLVGFIRVRLVFSGAPRTLSGSFVVIRARPRSCGVHFDSFGSAQAIFRFHSSTDKGSSRSFVHWHATRGSLCSFAFFANSDTPLWIVGIISFVQARIGSRWHHWGSFSSFAHCVG